MRPARRDRKKEWFWRRRIRRQPSSGLSVRAWCRKHGLGEASFYWWRAQLARRDAEAMTLVPVRVSTDPSTRGVFDRSAEDGLLGRMEIVLPNQRCVRLTGPVDRQALAEVLAVLTSADGVAPGPATC